jgi:polysaccharide biosynthesis protein PslG
VGACIAQRARGARLFVGLVSEDVASGGPNYRTCELNRQVASGAAIIRQTFDWASIEPSRERYNFAFYDAFVGALAQHRIRVLPILFNPPRFRARRGKRRGTYPPRRFKDIGTFGAVLVRRYGPRGSFWASRRDLPKMAIRAWQIWNEPLIRVYWPPRPNARQYVRLLRAARRGIKRVDRRAQIVTAGLPNSSIGVPLKKYVTAMYKAKGNSAFDTLAINPYARTSKGVVRLVRQMRRLMNSHGDRKGWIWVTEFGWSTGGKSKKYRTSERGQASRVSSTLRSLYRRRKSLRLRGAIYYNWREIPPYPPLYQDFFGLHVGLHRLDGTPKPAAFAFAAAARRLR